MAPMQPGQSKEYDYSKLRIENEDTFTLEERWAMLREVENNNGFGNMDLLSQYRFWADNDPAVIKRYLRYASGVGHPDAAAVPSSLVHLFSYTVLGNEPGVTYQVNSAKLAGFSKAEILATMSFAFIEAGPKGMHPAARGAERMLWEWDDNAPSTFSWSPGWAPDPAAFASGLSFANDDLTPAEAKGLTEWYARVLGEVPAYVPLFIRHHPRALKLYRNRFEKAFGMTLPKQMAPVFLLHLAILLGRPDAIRQAAHMAKSFGLNKGTVIQVATTAGISGWFMGMEPAAQALAAVFDAWE